MTRLRFGARRLWLAAVVAVATSLIGQHAVAGPGVVARVGVGTTPVGLDLDERARLLVVANRDSNTVTIVDLQRPWHRTAVHVGRWPVDVVADVRRARSYVSVFLDGRVAVVDSKTRSMTGSIPVPGRPHRMALDAGADRLFVSSQGIDGGPGAVSVIDVETGVVKASIPASTPVGIAIDETRNLVFVAGGRSGMVRVLHADTLAEQGAIGGFESAFAVVFDDTTGRLYVTDTLAGTVTVFDGVSNERLAHVDVCMGPTDVALDTEDQQAYVACFWTNEVVAFDAASMTERARVPQVYRPYAVAVDPRYHRLYATGMIDAVVYVLTEDAVPPQSVIEASDGDLVLNVFGLVGLTGSTEDDASGVEWVRVEWTALDREEPPLEEFASLACGDPSARRCRWRAAGPIVPGRYRARAYAGDRAGSMERPGPSVDVLVVV